MRPDEPTVALDLQRSLAGAYKGVQGIGRIPLRTDAGIYLFHDASVLASQEEYPFWIKTQVSGDSGGGWRTSIISMYMATGTVSLAWIAKHGEANIDLVEFDIWLLDAVAINEDDLLTWDLAALTHSPYQGKANAWGSGYAGDHTRILKYWNAEIVDVDNSQHMRFVNDGTGEPSSQRLLPCRLHYMDVLRCMANDLMADADDHVHFELLFTATPKGVLPASVLGS